MGKATKTRKTKITPRVETKRLRCKKITKKKKSHPAKGGNGSRRITQ